MRTTSALSTCFTLAIVASGCSRDAAPNTARTDTASPVKVEAPLVENATADGADATTVAESDDGEPGKIKPLTARQQTQLLDARLNGGMDFTFRQFANMFLVSSRLQLGQGVGLMTPSQKIAESVLQSSFPGSYQPTLREFLDALGLQTASQWKYDPSSKYFKSNIPEPGPVTGLAIFEFTESKREKPFEVTLAEGWKAIDKGNWVMHVPPSFPVGMDIYEVGTFSTDDPALDKDFLKKMPTAIALEWAQRVNEKAGPADLKPAKVGKFEAVFYDSMIPSLLNKDIHWRQWAFMVDNQGYFIVSTILPELESEILPDVEKMLASFRMKAAN